MRAAALTVIVALAGRSAIAQDRPITIVNALYTQVVARHPLGIPYGMNAEVFTPYLSKALLHRFDLNKACAADWYRQNPDPNLKPVVGLFEDGIFSGPDEKGEPKAFHIERTELRNDGSARVYVRLAWEGAGSERMAWTVAAVVVRERGRSVVDDILYLKDKGGGIDYRLSGALASGCRGGHWVGRRR